MRLEARSNISLPKKDKYRVLPLRDLRIEKNGIDRIPTPTKNQGLIYEDYCFDSLLQAFPQDYVIGPRLIDYMGDTCHFSLFNSKGRTRPDALILSTYLGVTFLSAIAELKSGFDPDLRSKANGFQDLFKALEADPTAIYRGFNMSIGNQAEILPIYPKKIYPLDDRLKVIFITNFEVEPLKDSYPNLELVYSRQEMPQAIIA